MITEVHKLKYLNIYIQSVRIYVMCHNQRSNCILEWTILANHDIDLLIRNNYM